MKDSQDINKWHVDVKFTGNGALLATATGVLLAPPKVALALVTDEAGDPLFRVVERKELPPGVSGGRRVEVVNKAAIRVLAWKLWSKSTVVYEIGHSEQEPEGLDGLLHSQQLEQKEETVCFELKSGNMLQSLSGRWSLQPIRLHPSALPHNIRNALSTSSPTAAAAAAAGAAAGAHSNSKISLLQCPSPSLTPLRSGNLARDTTLGLAAFQEPGRGLKIRTANTNSSSNTQASIGSPAKAKLLEKLAMLSPRKRTAAAATAAAATAAGDVLSSRPVVEITARTSSGPFTGGSSSSGGIDSNSIDDSNCSSRGLRVTPLEDLSNSSSNSSRGGGKGLSPIRTAGTVQNPGATLPPGLAVDADGYVLATYVQYEQLAQPRGMPAGIRYVPGLSDAVASSIGREVRQMLDKVSCVSDVVVAQGLSPQEALTAVVQAMQAAGGSFKALQKTLRKQQQQHTKQQQQQQRDASAETPGSPFSYLKASSGLSAAFSEVHAASNAAATLLSGSAGAAAAAAWGEEAGTGNSSMLSSGGRKCSEAGRKTSGAGRRVSAVSVLSAAVADGAGVGDDVQRLLREDSVGAATSLNPVLGPIGVGGGWGLEGCGSGGVASRRELMSHPVVMGECSWGGCDE